MIRIPLSTSLLLLVFSSPCLAATIDVTTTADGFQNEGQCSLREAIEAANSNTAIDTCAAGTKGDVIQIPGGTYTLALSGRGDDTNATGDLDILDDLSIVGSRSLRTIVIDGAELDRVFDVHLGVDFILENVTLTGGDADSGGESGGCIRSQGDVRLVEAILTGCSALNGGAISHSEDGTLVLELTRVENNEASVHAGGIWDIQSYNRTIISDSTIGGNTAGGLAGGVFTRSIQLVRSTVRDNVASEDGGGIYWPSDAGSQSMAENSTVSGNQTGENGGGLYFGGAGRLYLSNVTIAGNTADADGNDDGGGGGVYIPGTAEIRTRNSIVATNSDLSTGLFASYSPDCVGAFTSYGYNLFGEPGAGFCTLSAASGDLVGSIGAPLDPELGSLGSNGGRTLTMKPDLASPVVDAGDPNGCTDHAGSLLSTDQRKNVRHEDGPDIDALAQCDIGAVELSSPAGETIFSDGFESGDTSAWTTN